MQSDIMMINKNRSKVVEYQKFFKDLSEDEPEIVNTRNNPLFENNIRVNMVKWLVFLCEKLNFNNQTLFRSVIIFDKYISIIKDEEMTQEKLNLIAIACLSLGTKTEEINCNYVSFLTEKVLNMPNLPLFTVKDLTKMEMKILKELKYKTLYTTSIDFNDIYIGILKTFFDDSITSENIIQSIKNLSEKLMKENITNNNYLNMTQSNFAYICLNQAFFQLGLTNLLIIEQVACILCNVQNGMNMNFNVMKGFPHALQNKNLVSCSPFSSLYRL